MSANAGEAAALLALVPLAGCQLGGQGKPVEVDRDAVHTTSGVGYEDQFLGRGSAAGIGDEVLLDYTLFLADGTRVDSTLDRGVPVPVVVGQAFVRGLDDGLMGIRVDGRRRISVPPELGYGSEGVPGLVPPGAALVFEVHAVEIRRGTAMKP